MRKIWKKGRKHKSKKYEEYEEYQAYQEYQEYDQSLDFEKSHHMNSKFKKKSLVDRIYTLFVITIAGILILHYLYQNSSIFYTNSFNLPFSLHLNKDDLYLVKGEEFHLYVYAINKRVSFYSTDFRVAGVNFNGRVYGYQTGKAFIIANVDDRELKCRVHVIDINKKKISLKVGESYRLRIRGSYSFVGWHSKNKAIASVGLFGKVTARTKGTTVIYGKIKGKILKCTVIVE